MEFLIIRHAQSTNNALSDQRQRTVDPPLTELGRRQAAILARHLAEGNDFESGPCEGEPPNGAEGNCFGITHLYCSAMCRALETTQPVGLALGLQPEVWIDLHEQGGMWLDLGAPTGIRGYPGMTRAQIRARFPETALPAEIADMGWWTGGFEEMPAVLARAARVAAALRARRHESGRLALVTHGSFSVYLLKALLEVPIESTVFFHHDNTGITRVRFRDDGAVSVRYLNRLDHLPKELVS